MNQSADAPYGYDLVENPTEQAIIRQIVAWRTEGHGCKTIAQRLTEAGIPTKSGKQAWLHTTVAQILRRTNPSQRNQT